VVTWMKQNKFNNYLIYHLTLTKTLLQYRHEEK